MIASHWKPLGFIVAGMVNIVGILIVTRGLQSDTLALADPGVFSFFGLLMIMLWGLAYLASAPHATSSIWLPAVFGLEKLAYTLNWVQWTSAHAQTLPAIREHDLLGSMFLAGYGINDGIFMVFFATVAFLNWKSARGSH